MIQLFNFFFGVKSFPQRWCLMVIQLVILSSTIMMVSGQFDSMNEHLGRQEDHIEFDVGEITQKLDHFDLNNKETFTQKYLYESSSFCFGPVFLYLSPKPINQLQYQFTQIPIYNWLKNSVQNLQGKLVVAAVRHFDQDQIINPSGQKMYQNEQNLRFLSAKQIKQDVIELMQHFRSNEIHGITSETKFIVLGDSYFGSISIMLRREYPNLVLAAVAQNPIQMFPRTGLNQEVLTVINQEVNSNQCGNQIQEFYKDVKEQLDKEDRTGFIRFEFDKLGCGENEMIEIISLCLIMLFQRREAPSMCLTFDNYLNANNQYLRIKSWVASYLHKKIEVSLSSREHLKSNTEDNIIFRSWTWLQCREMQLYFLPDQSTDGPSIMSRGIDLKYYERFCKDIFGEDVFYDGDQQVIEGMKSPFESISGDQKITNVILISNMFQLYEAVMRSSNPTKTWITIQCHFCNEIYPSFLKTILSQGLEDVELIRQSFIEEIQKIINENP